MGCRDRGGTRPGPGRDALESLGARTGHWTLVSSCSVYADHSVPGAAEDAALLPPLADGEASTPETYGESKSAIERPPRAGRRQGPYCPCRALSPVLATAPTATATGRPASPGTTRLSWSPASPAPTQVIDVRDLAAWILKAAGQGTTGALNALGDQVPFAQYVAASREAAGHTGHILDAPPEWLAGQGIAYWSGPDSLPLWLPPGHDGFMARSNQAARDAGLVLRPWEETIADVLRDERVRGLRRPRNAGLAPDTEAGLVRRAPGGGQSSAGNVA